MVSRSKSGRPRYQTALGRHVREVLEKHAVASAFQYSLSPQPAEQPISKAVTFRLLGDRCTRGCIFCGTVHQRRPPKPDTKEPQKIAHAVDELGLDNIVLTAVHRDDLRDGGAGHFARTISAIKARRPWAIVEASIPDFGSSKGSVEKIVGSGPEVVHHNLETVKRLSSGFRGQSSYKRSLDVLSKVRELNPEIITRSSLAIGMGERWGEVLAAMRHLRRAGVQELKIVQYMRPTNKHPRVAEYVGAERFEFYERIAYELGFSNVVSGRPSKV